MWKADVSFIFNHFYAKEICILNLYDMFGFSIHYKKIYSVSEKDLYRWILIYFANINVKYMRHKHGKCLPLFGCGFKRLLDKSLLFI